MPEENLQKGPRSNFKIGMGGGGGPLLTQYLGGHKTLFLLILYTFKHIGGGYSPLLRGPCATIFENTGGQKEQRSMRTPWKIQL